jgi:hypothetical protein
MIESNNTKICDVCGERKKNVSLEPSRSQLLFGGFKLKFENRCRSCERKVSKWVDKLLTTIEDQ